MSVKREIFRHKYYVVAREKGKIRAMRKWNFKFTSPKARVLFKSNRTFVKDLKKRQMTTRPFTEVTDTRKQPFIPKQKPFRVIVTGKLKDGAIIQASSSASIKSFTEHKAEALESFYERVAQHFNLEYDADEGLTMSKEIISIKTSIIRVV